MYNLSCEPEKNDQRKYFGAKQLIFKEYVFCIIADSLSVFYFEVVDLKYFELLIVDFHNYLLMIFPKTSTILEQ